MNKSRTRSKEKDVPTWDVVSGLSVRLGEVLQIMPALIPILQNGEIMGRITDRPRFDRLAGSLDRDLRRLTQDYRDLRNAHAGRTGEIASPTELMQSIDLFEKYVNWASNFDDTITPTFRDMTMMLQEAGVDTSSIHVQSATLTVEQTPH